ncbi:MAG: hypothetical protein QOJ63_674 [Solirubrobacteraceae bacterium]|nr:hypothetical protein [Solirubrobacteraceae bacterium]
MTVELCGRVDHEGPCRWPHNGAIDTGGESARFRTLFVADDSEAALVRQRINTALRSSSWRVLAVRPRPVAAGERALADRLLAGPRLWAAFELREDFMRPGVPTARYG